MEGVNTSLMSEMPFQNPRAASAVIGCRFLDQDAEDADEEDDDVHVEKFGGAGKHPVRHPTRFSLGSRCNVEPTERSLSYSDPLRSSLGRLAVGRAADTHSIILVEVRDLSQIYGSRHSYVLACHLSSLRG